MLKIFLALFVLLKEISTILLIFFAPRLDHGLVMVGTYEFEIGFALIVFFLKAFVAWCSSNGTS